MGNYLWVIVAGAVAAILGLAGTMTGLDWLRIARQAGPRPRTVTCEALRQHGPPGTLHVTLTGFRARRQGVMRTTREDGSWLQTWVPLVPAGGPDRPQDVCAVLITDRVHNWAELDRLLAGGVLTGLLKSQGVTYQADCLEQHNLGARLELCWVLLEGEQPGSIPTAVALAAAGVVAFGVGLVLTAHGSLRLDPKAPWTPATHSPLVLSLQAIARLWAWQRLLPQSWTGPLLAAVGACVLGFGWTLVCRGGLCVMQSLNGPLAFGAALLDVGFALLLLGLYTVGQAGREPGPDDKAQVAPTTQGA